MKVITYNRHDTICSQFFHQPDIVFCIRTCWHRYLLYRYHNLEQDNYPDMLSEDK